MIDGHEIPRSVNVSMGPARAVQEDPESVVERASPVSVVPCSPTATHWVVDGQAIASRSPVPVGNASFVHVLPASDVMTIEPFPTVDCPTA